MQGVLSTTMNDDDPAEPALESSIRSVIELVWDTTLQSPVDWSQYEALESADTLLGTIGIEGDFSGQIRMRFSPEVGRHAAAALFGIPVDAASAQDVADALAEVLNIVAGNVKGLLEGSNALSLPRVAAGLCKPAAQEPAPLAQLRFGSRGGACEFELRRSAQARAVEAA